MPGKRSFVSMSFQMQLFQDLNADYDSQNKFYLSITSEFKIEEDCGVFRYFYFKHHILPMHYVFRTDFILR